ncbi:MAG: hypothetical protein K6F80_06355 [Oscillospiraceae bacterium]|nr:hypothetical protein [Oscillospiraceae bacterium]
MKHTILEIYEEDHGCEGLSPGEELMDMAFVRDEDGTEHWMRIPDRVGKHLDRGDVFETE